MSKMFAYTSLDQDFALWDVSNVQDMSSMFEENRAFQGVGLYRWDVSAVKNMSAMFRYATNFNEPISFWDVTSAKDISQMFLGATAFDQDLSAWIQKLPGNLSP